MTSAPEERGFVVELQELAKLRWRLLEAELRQDASTLKFCLILATLGLVLAATALPLLVWVASVALADALQWSRNVTLLAVAVPLLAAGTLLLWFAWRRARYGLLAFRDSLAECREDLLWIQEFRETAK